jgi:hypothetical protein
VEFNFIALETIAAILSVYLFDVLPGVNARGFLKSLSGFSLSSSSLTWLRLRVEAEGNLSRDFKFGAPHRIY